jgi:phospholipid transport system substrate-binding protein
MITRHGARAATRNLMLAGMMMAMTGLSVQAAEPEADPRAVVTALSQNLLDTMRNARQLGYKGRYAKLEPVVRQAFDVPYMTKVAVGAGWDGLTPVQQAALADAFGDFIAATYARRFDGYDGEKFVTQGEHPIGNAMLVQTQLIKSDGEPVALNYVARRDDGQWRVVDIFLTGTISELATRRSEFSSVFRASGYDGLLGALRQKVARIESEAQLS